MITRVHLEYFKQFSDQTFELSDHVVLAGPNNSGKSTLLQAIAVWHLAVRRWQLAHQATSRARRRAAVPITRKDFTAVPLRAMNLLWTDTSTALRRSEGGKAGFPRIARVTLEGGEGDGAWELPIELRYQGPEQIYAKPAADYLDELPAGARDLSLVHVPPFSGIGAEETRYDQPYQDLLIGQGKPGDLLRNLLLEVHGLADKQAWEDLCRQVEEIFQFQLLPPRYEGTPFIVCEYRPGIPGKSRERSLPRLDVASAGSGFHQVLLLLAFFYARPASVLLLDEPDAHQHIVLQKQIYDLLRRIAAERRSQLIIATHAEVLINSTSPNRILSFFQEPHGLVADVERERIAEALRQLPATDLLLAEDAPGVLYVEGETDFNLLRAWSEVLDHPLGRWFANQPFWHNNQGRHPREARRHLFALQAIAPEIRGVLLLDGDNRGLPDHEVAAGGLGIERWRRYEAESYLLHPQALLRFIDAHTPPLSAKLAEDFLRDRLPPAVYRDPLQPDDYLETTPASKTLLPALFNSCGRNLPKQDYYRIAEQMKPEEIPQEVREKLDRLAEILLQ